MTIAVEMDQKTESALHAEAVRLQRDPVELAGELLRQVVDNRELLASLTQPQDVPPPIEESQFPGHSEIVLKLFGIRPRPHKTGQMMRFGEFRGQLGDLSEEDFKSAEFVLPCTDEE